MKRVLVTIQKNVASLFDAAEILASKKHHGPAIHLMMAAREEAVKWIALQCWNHLDNETRGQIFRHDFKHKAAGVFYFLNGELQAIDYAIGAFELLKEKSPELARDTEVIIQYLPRISSIDDPKKLASVITRTLSNYQQPDESEEITKKRRDALRRLVDEGETTRQKSIYVDFDGSLEITGEPSNFTQADYQKIKRDVVLAKYYIDKVIGLDPNKEILYAVFPEWRTEIDKGLAELANDFAISKTVDSTTALSKT
jgi:AbiV family abortive infection protein